MIMALPRYIKYVLEEHGIEGSDLEQDGNDLLINSHEFEEAYEIRNKLLAAESHVITLHNSTRRIATIVVRVQEVLNQTKT